MKEREGEGSEEMRRGEIRYREGRCQRERERGEGRGEREGDIEYQKLFHPHIPSCLRTSMKFLLST